VLRIMLCRITIVVALAAWAGAAQAVTFSVTDLRAIGAAQGAEFANAAAISPDGTQIVGTMRFSAGGFYHERAFLYADDTLTNLHSFDGRDDTYATGVNNAGHVVGWISVYHDENSGPGFYVHPFLNTGGASVTLPYDGAEVYSINTSDQISGQHLEFGTGVEHLLLCEADGSSSYLSTSGVDVWNEGINDDGWVVAWGHTQSPDPYAIVNRPTSLGRVSIDLGHIPDGEEVHPLDINNDGMVVGGGMTGAASIEHAFLSVVDGEGYSTPIDLGTLSEGMGNWSRAQAINNYGWIVGSGSRGALPARGFLAIDSGSGYEELLDLNDLLRSSDQSLWTIEDAIDVADTGQILGVARDAGGGLHSVLLTPVPEPSALALLAIGGIGVLGFVRRARVPGP